VAEVARYYCRWGLRWIRPGKDDRCLGFEGKENRAGLRAGLKKERFWYIPHSTYFTKTVSCLIKALIFCFGRYSWSTAWSHPQIEQGNFSGFTSLIAGLSGYYTLFFLHFLWKLTWFQPRTCVLCMMSCFQWKAILEVVRGFLSKALHSKFIISAPRSHSTVHSRTHSCTSHICWCSALIGPVSHHATTHQFGISKTFCSAVGIHSDRSYR